jgi:putative redox protein
MTLPASTFQVRVESLGKGFAQRIESGRHVMSADEPLSAGGTDTGPNPYDLLLAALGACTSMTLSMYAAKKGWPLEKVVVRLAHARIHAEDCKNCDTKEGFADRLEREIELAGSLSDEQRARLIEIAERCPVHRTLMGPKEIVTRLARAS